MNKMSGKKIGITIACTVATALLTLCAGVFAPFAILFGLCASVFAAYLYIRCGAVCAIINAVITSLAMLALGRVWDVLLVVAIGVIPGLISGYIQKKNRPYYESLLWVCCAFGAVLIGILFYTGQTVPGGISGMFKETANAMKESAALVLSGAESSSVADVNAVIDAMIELTKRTIPSMLIIVSMVLGYIHIAVVEFFVRKISGVKLNYVHLDEHIAPKHIIYAYLIITLLSLFSSGEGMMGVIVSNALSVIDFVLAFCGLSFIESKFKGKLKYGFLRGIIYVGALMLLSNVAMQILSIAGMIDGFVNYRGIKRNGE